MDLNIQHIFQSLNGISAPLLYIVLFFSAILENIFPPIPGDTVTAFGAYLVGSGKLNFALVYIVTTIGSTAGFYLLFAIARQMGPSLSNHTVFRWLKPDSLGKAQKALGKYSYAIILANRFLPGIRSVISISAGLIQMKRVPVIIFSLISALFWNLIWIYAGYTVGSNWESIYTKISSLGRTYNIAAGIIAGIIIIILIARRVIRKRTI